MKRIGLIICSVVFFSSCSFFEESTVTPDELYFNESTVNLYVNNKGNLYLTCVPTKYLDLYAVTYTSSDNSVVLITEESKTGVTFVASKVGSAIITATLGGGSTKCAVNVLAATDTTTYTTDTGSTLTK